MSELIQAGWAKGYHPTPQETLQQLRSLSSKDTARKPKAVQRPVAKSVSTGALHSMASVASDAALPPIPPPKSISPLYSDADGNMSTLPDPRSRAVSFANDNAPGAHPDLSNEVATLSNKLISAINHQTNLDDSLSETRHALEESQKRVKQLEQENKDHAELLARGILIRKSVAEVEKSKLVAQLTEERRLRAEVEKEKKSIEQELENLTTALFEEANKMVITAREAAQKDHDMVQKRNDQLKAQLADTESLLKSHQEQLAELKQVMEQMTEEREESSNLTAPSTPGLSKFDSKDELRNSSEGTHPSSIPDPVSPSYPTSFTHIVQLVLRTDLSAYDDFTSILRMSKNVMGSRVSSGSYGAIGLGLGLGGYTGGASNSSTTSISTSHGSSPVTPTTPASSVSSSSSNGPNSLTPLKDTKFYKRALAEDIEPTLRLDSAPGLSWLARRTVLNAVCEGFLVIEPMPSSTKPYAFACSLCGESRKDTAHIRSHRFRTSENENAQRYPLCRYCHGRVRSTCDFLGFLRILKEGHWRADDEASEKAAWEESVRLREQMFWCRMGGGVVPAQQVSQELSRSPRLSGDTRSDQEKELTVELAEKGEIQPRDVTTPTELSPRVSTNQVPNEVSMLSDKSQHANADSKKNDASLPSPLRTVSTEHDTPPEEVMVIDNQMGKENVRESVQSVSSLEADGQNEGAQRLSITIPGAQG
ncbi:hypothetical protein HYFRA_00011815 [Hymenoscyphus fraxineus]|uniref:GDP/GTP exchange factor Sec2 N-terminal domain-containing protein n=1 Tax=Hymenoscyphus fraxineus TaxID=746836 RepID=A0A9N9L7C3_9HELO|nr:hypothetical protein HYFRA_00011815 [Hymenoscyphus fraxineus]